MAFQEPNHSESICKVQIGVLLIETPNSPQDLKQLPLAFAKSIYVHLRLQEYRYLQNKIHLAGSMAHLQL